MSVEEVRTLCYFCKQKLQPLFEDSLGAGYVQRTKKEMLAFMTREQLFCDELSESDDSYAYSADGYDR